MKKRASRYFTKENCHKFLYLVSALLLLGFYIRLGADYYMYDATATSAPFYALVIERSLEFILPALLLFVATRVAKKVFGIR